MYKYIDVLANPNMTNAVKCILNKLQKIGKLSLMKKVQISNNFVY